MSSKKKGVYGSKVKKATQMLFYKRHQKPGVKGWELHKALGSDYPKVLDLLEDYLEPLDLQVKTVFEEEKAPESRRWRSLIGQDSSLHCRMAL